MVEVTISSILHIDSLSRSFHLSQPSSSFSLAVNNRTFDDSDSVSDCLGLPARVPTRGTRRQEKDFGSFELSSSTLERTLLSLIVGGSSGGRGTAIGEREIEIVSEIYAESERSERGGKRAEELTSGRGQLRE